MSETIRPDWANYPPFVATAYGLAERHHAGQVDKAGNPYLGHVVAVAEKCRRHGCEAVAAGLLHDIVEDTDVTLEDLRAAGMPDAVVEAVDAVTRRTGETYDDLITRAAAHRLGRLVKLADNANNADPARLAPLDDDARAWFTAKYAKARVTLEEAAAAVSEPCTGITASWCPNHGECRCPRDDQGEAASLDDQRCPLHADDSDHAEVDMRDVLATAFETDGGGCDHGEPACSACLADIAIRTMRAGRALWL